MQHRGLIAINQDALGAQAMKRMTFLEPGVTAVAAEACAIEMTGRNFSQRWSVDMDTKDTDSVTIKSFDGRCLGEADGRVVVLPCTNHSMWWLDRGMEAPTAVLSATSRLAIYLNNTDWHSVGLRKYTPEAECVNAANCSTDATAQATLMWYHEPSRNGRLTAATWSTNSFQAGRAPGVPLSGVADDFGRRCLALAMDGPLQVWTGPLSGGAAVVLLLNRLPVGGQAVTFGATWAQLGLDDKRWDTIDVFSGEAHVAVAGITAAVEPHDVRVFRLSPLAE